MNFYLTEKRTPLLVLILVLLGIGLAWLAYSTLFKDSNPLHSNELAHNIAAGTRTALGLTAEALLGPFPTPTAPTQTASSTITATLTPTITRTPSSTPNASNTPIIVTTGTEFHPSRTAIPTSTRTSTPKPPPTNTPVPPATNTPQPSYP